MFMSFGSQLNGQDPVFSQYFHSPLVINPAIAGLSDDANLFLNYRNQWSGLPNAYRTYSVSYDQFFEEVNSGVGILLLSDNAGDGILTTTKIAGIYSYRIQLNKDHYVKGGFEFGLVQSRINWEKLVFFDQLDPEFGRISPGGTPYPSTEQAPDQMSNIYADVGLGAMYYNPFFYAGISLKHLNTPDQSFLKQNSNLLPGLPMRISAQVGSEIILFDGNRSRLPIYVSPSALWVRQGDLQQLNIGTFINLGAFGVGGWYRTSFENADAVIGAVSFRTGKIKISYSFDYTVSALELNGGTHEIGIGINFDDGVKESIYNDCFSIFR
jgi:type IX secretion system PorP/SprF family membrane protein